MATAKGTLLTPDDVVVKEGTFLYDGTVLCHLHVVHSRLWRGSGDYEDPPEICNDRDCDAYYVWYSSTTDTENFNSGSGPYANLDEAVAGAQAAPGIGPTVRWKNGNEDHANICLVHQGTDRHITVVRSNDFATSKPVKLEGRKYVLFIASHRAARFSTPELARRWIDAGAVYVCAWGPASEQVEEDFDYASFLPDLGTPLPFTLMTTSHPDESLFESLWFALYSAQPVSNLDAELDDVVILVDSSELEHACLSWVRSNTE
ncbi:DUF7684 family protein [Piscinibacter terrae]|uniref:DUF7684 family protein n=1 Tax=Piscinibacter terrae TaxID=2496871 RepID=UPI000F5B5AC7|nr:hypothetical protein [Albitalea terrae]